jgi:excinuclease ABC subunit A
MSIVIKGACTHNLKKINLTIPANQLIAITGVSGSGKSSLAFHTLHAEGQRRYIASLPMHARYALSAMEKPHVTSIDGLPPSIALEQKAHPHHPRSTVGTLTETYDYLRVLFANIGQAHCPTHGGMMTAYTPALIWDTLQIWYHHNVVITMPHQWTSDSTDYLMKHGFALYDHTPDALPTQHIVIDRLTMIDAQRDRFLDGITLAFQHGGVACVSLLNSSDYQWFYQTPHCLQCDTIMVIPEPKHFSFNSAIGACPACQGAGVLPHVNPDALVLFPQRSILKGAMPLFDCKQKIYHTLWKALAKHFKITLETPYEQLPQKLQHALHHGAPWLSFDGMLAIASAINHKNSDTKYYLQWLTCDACKGTRLNALARSFTVQGRTLDAFCNDTIATLLDNITQLALSPMQMAIALPIVDGLAQRLRFLKSVDVGYLTLGRSAQTLSSGELQRMRLANQLGSGLVGVLYVVDEPCIGLHVSDKKNILKALQSLRDLGNTVIAVEHDEQFLKSADYLIELGPGAGILGGDVVAQGSLDVILQGSSLTGQYLSKKKQLPFAERLPYPTQADDVVHLSNCHAHFLKNISVDIPINRITVVVGRSGSGKSTLIHHTLLPWAYKHVYGYTHQSLHTCQKVLGLHHFDKVIAIDQQPIGKTPRSNPATYMGFFKDIRTLFSNIPDAKMHGFGIGHFSFNVPGGRCEACKGDGLLKITMHFLPDVYVTCDHCHGKRYNHTVLTVKFKGHSIIDVLNATVEDACCLFQAFPAIHAPLKTLQTIGLGYLTLGQSATTLSGGEIQRLKLAKELTKRDSGRTLYILDEPTIGLHTHDIGQLLAMLFQLRQKGNTIVIVEHHPLMIERADWIIELGPEGGIAGGYVLAIGTPDDIRANPNSITGAWL